MRGARRLTIGIDVGQKRDPTAIAVAESEIRSLAEPKTAQHYLVRHLERLPLGTPYPDVASRLAEICQRTSLHGGRRPDVFVDATGVGSPIVDLLEVQEIEAERLWAVYFTHGNRRNVDHDAQKIILGKARLVSRLQALLQNNRLHLPATAEAQALGQELMDYEIRVDENATARFGAFRVGSHDDLVTAVGLAVQE